VKVETQTLDPKPKTMDPSVVREATVADLLMLAGHGHEFFAEGGLPGRFKAEVFVQNWRMLLDGGVGVIFMACRDGELAGAIGGLIYPDVNDGELTTMETFWFVRAAHRGGTLGLRLMQRYEDWARWRGAARIGMVHLTGLMPDRLRSIYERRGYREAEIHYFKPLDRLGANHTGTDLET
jgi:GNAT superfamily N-acetyltransferase